MNKKLYVGNLPFAADDAALRTHFEGAGLTVTSAKVMMDRETGRSRGFGFVEFGTPEEAQKALAQFNGQQFMGRPLMINEAREQAPRPGGGFGGPRPGGGFGGPRPGGGGFGGPRPNSGGGGGGFSGGGGGYPPPGFDPANDPAAGGGSGRRDRDRGKDRDRKRRGGNDDDWS
jgi:RNA recognition motif-containing protein